MVASYRELPPHCSTQERSCDTKHNVDVDTRHPGAAVRGPGDEGIHCVYAEALYTVMHQAMHTRPTVSEYIRLRLE